MAPLTRVAIGLGSNLGDREAFILLATHRLAQECLQETLCSSLYETEPWGVTDQPKFLNAVVTGWTAERPPAVLHFLKQLERELGRKETIRFGPREIDLDLLAFGEESWNSEGLIVPHVRLAERDFVLLPLAEIWPEWRHPVGGKTSGELLEAGGFLNLPQPYRLSSRSKFAGLPPFRSVPSIGRRAR